MSSARLLGPLVALAIVGFLGTLAPAELEGLRPVAAARAACEQAVRRAAHPAVVDPTAPPEERAAAQRAMERALARCGS